MSEHSMNQSELDCEELASALLMRVVQTLRGSGRESGSSAAWARRRIGRLEHRITELEKELSRSKAETRKKTSECERLRQHLEHSEGNLALLSEKLGAEPNCTPSVELLPGDEALLRQLQQNVAAS